MGVDIRVRVRGGGHVSQIYGKMTVHAGVKTYIAVGGHIVCVHCSSDVSRG